jgi:thioredoxin 1
MVVRLFILRGCPYCKRALGYIEELQTDPKYQVITFELIDEEEHPEIVAQYSYYYVPTFYYQGVKLYEGAINKAQVQELMDKVLNDAGNLN